MENYLLFAVGILVILAVVDLVVGVANDAVNFLNAAIGSKAAAPKVILAIASVGVFAGALFSNGMMEIARSGVFYPQEFAMNHVFIIFLAVMITDILLLDVYNSLGLPTSTTVSIVFELLGASFAVGLLIIGAQGGFDLGRIGEFVNFGSTTRIVSGIFLSIAIAFVSGNLIHSLVRFVFTFDFKKNLRLFGAPFSAVALTAIIYFLLIKGLKGTTLFNAELISWVLGNTGWLLMASFAFFSVLIQILMWTLGVNPLRVVVLVGTFALAMAFAGNDLVNFIGVPMAGLQVFQSFQSAGVPAAQFSMDILNNPARTDNLLLLGAGLIMVLTLWFSARAKKVTETEVNLARQDDGDERFKANALSRFLVTRVMDASQAVGRWVPESWSKSVEKRYFNRPAAVPAADAPAFDLVRASVNLLVSSVLIAMATSLKLPLSTTYVTFMVAMGSSLADGSWGRESAVYRVAGVVNVVSGWLLTALFAFLVAGLVAVWLWFTGMVGLVIAVAIAFGLMVRSAIRFTRKKKAEDAQKVEEQAILTEDSEAVEAIRKDAHRWLELVRKHYTAGLVEFFAEKGRPLERNLLAVKDLKKGLREGQVKTMRFIKRNPFKTIEPARLYMLHYDLLADAYQSMVQLLEVMTEHLLNKHHPPTKEWTRHLEQLMVQEDAFLEQVIAQIHRPTDQGIKAISKERKRLQALVYELLDKLAESGKKGQLSNRLGVVIMSILLETKDLNAALERHLELFEVYGSGGKK
jgi:phosphate/sulfate permease